MRKSILFSIIILCLGLSKSYGQFVPCNPGLCASCMTITLFNHTACPQDWVFEYNPSCSVNPGLHLDPGAKKVIAGTCGKCTYEGMCKCPIAFSLVDQSAVGGFIDDWGDFSVWQFPSVVEYHNLNYSGCGCSDFWVRITLFSPTSAQYDIYCTP